MTTHSVNDLVIVNTCGVLLLSLIQLILMCVCVFSFSSKSKLTLKRLKMLHYLPFVLVAIHSNSGPRNLRWEEDNFGFKFEEMISLNSLLTSFCHARLV